MKNIKEVLTVPKFICYARLLLRLDDKVNQSLQRNLKILIS